jgi:hypothetical protein
MQESGSRSTPIGAILAIVGGALLAIGSFLTWATVSGAGTEVSAKGVDGSDGYVTLVAGLVALVCGLAAMKAGRRVLAVLTILAGIVGAGLGIYDALTAKDSVLDAAAEEVAIQVGATPEDVRALLDQAIDAGQLGISISLGLYIVIGGGALALVGGVMLLGARGAGAGEPAMPAGFAAAGAAQPAASPPVAGSMTDEPPPAAPTPPPPAAPPMPPSAPPSS